MSELRNVLYVVGSHDTAGVGQAGLCTAEMLSRDGLLRPVVCGPEGELIDFAAAAGLPVVRPLPASASRHRGGSLGRAMDDADLVHAVGLEAARLVHSVGAPNGVPLIVTIDALDARRVKNRWRGSPLWALRSHSPLRWLVPGRTATSRLVHSGLVRGDQVVTLPLLPFAKDVHQSWAAVRAAARERLGVAPGVQVVLGIGPAEVAPFCRSRTAIAMRAREMAVVWIDTGRSRRPPGAGRGGLTVVTADEGRRLLPAMDVLLANGTHLAARHPAVDARWAGVPIVTTPLDVASEMVRPSVNGFVCAPTEIMAGVEAALDMAASRTVAHDSAQRRGADPAGDAVTATARCYSSILGHPLVRPVLIGRQAAR